MQSASGAGGDRKYNHPNSLPTYNSSTVNQLDPYAGAVGSTNGRYLAPWGIFAVDWCKWPVSPGGNGLGGYGRVAIGSYSEDSHNCVGGFSHPSNQAQGTYQDPGPSSAESKAPWRLITHSLPCIELRFKS